MTKQAAIPGPVLEDICDIIADTDNDLTGIDKEDALDMMNVVSFVHKRLDHAI